MCEVIFKAISKERKRNIFNPLINITDTTSKYNLYITLLHNKKKMPVNQFPFIS